MISIPENKRENKPIKIAETIIYMPANANTFQIVGIAADLECLMLFLNIILRIKKLKGIDTSKIRHIPANKT